MLDPELLDILVCPESRRPVAPADPGVLARVNEAAAAGTLVNRAGRSVPLPLQGLLVRDDGRVGYPVRDDIPIMLIDESIDLAAIGAGASPDSAQP
ncbi:MAG: hypothetical protein HKN71_12765 [Gemmatimonadetes bacterium]|nr:hypothetical protein [Gemmatimonadota bacterium]